MLKLRYFLYVVLIIFHIDGEICSPNGDISDTDLESVENNELRRLRKEKDKTNEKNSLENYVSDKTQDTNEQKSGEKKAEKEINNNKTVFCNHTKEISSLEDDEDDAMVNEEVNNRLGNNLEPTTEVVGFINKITTAILRQIRQKDRVLTNQSNELILRPHRLGIQNTSATLSPQEMPKESLKNIFVGGHGNMFFKSCHGKAKDDLCRRTLIDYPYAVSIQKMGSHYATGAFLDKRWILTVAGEFYNIRESIKLFRARLGSVNCKRGGVLLPLQEVRIHPLYVPEKPGYDLALLRMGEAVNYTDYIRPIQLSTVTDGVLSAMFMTNYWARLIVKGKLLPRNAPERTKPTSMRVSTQRLIGQQFCHKMMLEMNEQLQDASLCLKPLVTHHSLCMPDPGAPIVADDGLWGITSGWTPKLCHSLPGPTIFTRVSAPLVRSWLDSQHLGI